MRVFVLGIFTFGVAFAQTNRDAEALKVGVGIEEHLGETVPLELELTDRFGKQRSLKSFLEDQKPIIIVPVYYKCPGFCSSILNGVTTALNQTDLVLGQDFKVLAISFNPDEDYKDAAPKAENYYSMLEQQDGPAGWHFLTTTPESIHSIMGAIGFKYKRVGKEFSHPSMLAVVSPQGVITRYLYGVSYPKRDFKLAVIESSEGKVGTTLDRFLLYCYRFDQETGAYTVVAMKILRLGGVLTMVFMAIAGFFLFRKSPSNKRRMQQDAT